jgi:hypothetical protein
MRDNGAVGVQREKSRTRLCLPSRAASDDDDDADHDDVDDEEDHDAKNYSMAVSPCSSSWIQLFERHVAILLRLCRYSSLECIAKLQDVLMYVYRCF